MTQEKRQIVLKDLCARLPYGVIVNTLKGDGHLCSINQTIFGNEYGVNIKATKRDYFNDKETDIKPYFRPMSSMTDEEKKEYIVLDDLVTVDGVLVSSCSTFDWLNAHHFDYRGLIEKGLALEAPEGMYKQ